MMKNLMFKLIHNSEWMQKSNFCGYSSPMIEKLIII